MHPPSEVIDVEEEILRSRRANRRLSKAGDYDPDDSDGVVELEEAPEHLRKVTNRDNPIALVDSDDDAIQPSSGRRLRSRTAAGPSKSRRPVARHEAPTDSRSSSTVGSSGTTSSSMGVTRPSGSRTSAQKGRNNPVQPGPAASTAQRPLPPHQPAVGPLNLSDPDIRPALAVVLGSSASGHLSTVDAIKSSQGDVGIAGSSAFAEAALRPDPFSEVIDLLPPVLNVLPDIDPAWVLNKLKTGFEAWKIKKDHLVGRVLEDAFNMEGGYPRAADVASVNRPSQKAGQGYDDPKYRTDERKGTGYWGQSSAALLEQFPKMPASQ